MADEQRKRGPKLWLSLAVLGVGIALVVVGVVLIVGSVKDALTSEPIGAVAVQRQLDAATYDIYERTGTTTDAGVVHTSVSSLPTLTAEDVLVTGPTGGRVPVRSRTSVVTETINRGGGIYTAVLRFDAPVKGSYTIQLAGGDPSKQIVVARPVGDTFKQAVPGILLTIGGGLVGVAGLVLLIVGIVRRRSRPSAVPAFAGGPVPGQGTAPGGPPPGWYADPAGGGRRYWDGARWTEHQA